MHDTTQARAGASRTANPDQRRTFRAAVLGLVLFGLATVLACTSKACDGAECSVPCRDESCQDDSLCVNSVCRPACESDATCLGDDSCQRVRTDQGKEGRYCYGPALAVSPYVKQAVPGDSSAANASTACTKNSNCKTNPAQACVEGMCLTLCQVHAHCGTAGACTGDAKDVTGNAVHYCEPDSFPRASGQYGSTCYAAGSSCDRAQNFFCSGGGEGDTDSFCTQTGCNGDSECPSGYFCSVQKTDAPVCQDVCGLTADPSDPQCIKQVDVGPGRPFRCAQRAGIEIALCQRRSFCNACENDADCRALPNQICAQGPDGAKICTQLCSAEDHSCPWGSATECKLYDQQLGRATCGHRFGQCAGQGRSCEPCVNDADCPKGYCATSTYTGERFCIDAAVQCSCKDGESSCAGGGCPESPSGLALTCVPRAEGDPPSACFGANTRPAETSSLLGCWPEQ